MIDTKALQDVLGSAETEQALLEVARNAHRAEQTLAHISKLISDRLGGELDDAATLAEIDAILDKGD